MQIMLTVAAASNKSKDELRWFCLQVWECNLDITVTPIFEAQVSRCYDSRLVGMSRQTLSGSQAQVLRANPVSCLSLNLVLHRARTWIVQLFFASLTARLRTEAGSRLSQTKRYKYSSQLV